ncbi:MAG: hypothetical protein COA78_00655 [Blastopirellula sp.]|nr:MAG: hypothetical protein COA78_00655 [Blastopirellula sp.]
MKKRIQSFVRIRAGVDRLRQTKKVPKEVVLNDLANYAIVLAPEPNGLRTLLRDIARKKGLSIPMVIPPKISDVHA